MNIHIKRIDLFAVLTLTSDAGRTYITTLRRDILKTDPEVKEMVRRFKQEKKPINPKPVISHKQVYGRANRQKNGVAITHNEQGDML